MSERATKKQKVESADALDDDLEYEVGSDSAGEAESITPSDEDESDDHRDESGSVDSDHDSDKESPEVGDESSSSKVKVEKKQVSAEEKRKKRKLKKESTRARKAQEQVDGEEQGTASVALSVDQQVDTFARLVRDYAPKSTSSIELDDMTPPRSAFIDTTSFSSPRSLGALLGFMRRFSERERLEVANKECGRPHTVLITSSAIRVADLCRALNGTDGDGKDGSGLKTKQASLAKLFGKEKVAVQAEFLGKTRVNVAVGVPARVTALIQHGSLKIDRVEQVFLDTSYRDAKKRSLLTVKEVTRDLVLLLTQHEQLGPRIKRGECRLVLF